MNDVVQLHVPAIGTLLTLAEPWWFRLYFEDRNEKFLSKLLNADISWWGSNNPGRPKINYDKYHKNGKKPDCVGQTYEGYKIMYDTFGVPEDDEEKEAMGMASTWRSHDAMCYVDVEMPAGAMLTVDRIYIRKGVDAYNSLTFWAKKPAKLKKPKKGEPPLPPNPGYDFMNKIGGNRFWAKLPDVNKIKCTIV